jgi:hypothetical protein
MEGAYESGNPVLPKPSCEGPLVVIESPMVECNIKDNECMVNQWGEKWLWKGEFCPGYCGHDSPCWNDIGSFDCELSGVPG